MNSRIVIDSCYPYAYQVWRGDKAVLSTTDKDKALAHYRMIRADDVRNYGYDAYFAGKTDNPYPAGSTDFDHWADGHRLAWLDDVGLGDE